MQKAIGVRKSGSGFKVKEGDRDLIRETHRRAQESVPLRVEGATSVGRHAQKKSKRKSRGDHDHAPKRSRPAADSDVVRARSSRAERGTYSDARRKEIAHSLMFDEHQNYYQAWENSLPIAIAEFQGRS